MFLASFIAFYKTILCVCRHYRGTDDAWNASIAGLLAGTTLAIDSNKQRRMMVALYLSTRMLHFMSRFVWRHSIQHRIDPYSCSPSASIVNIDDLVPKTEVYSPLKRNHGQLRHVRTNFMFSSEESGIDSGESSPEQEKSTLARIEDEKILITRSKKTADTVRFVIRQSAAVLVMMLSSSQILYSFIVEPDTLAVSIFSHK